MRQCYRLAAEAGKGRAAVVGRTVRAGIFLTARLAVHYSRREFGIANGTLDSQRSS
jgi:hypothetical protein